MQATDTSRQAISGISIRRRKSLADEVALAIQQIERVNGDASMREIQDHLERHLGRRVDVSSISARVNELETAKRVVRDREVTRLCRVTGQSIHPLAISPEWRRLFA